MSGSGDLVVSWVSSGATLSFREVCPQESVHILLTFGSCWASPKGRVTLPKPYRFEVFFKNSHNGKDSLRIVSSGRSADLMVHPGTELRVYTPDGILSVIMPFPIVTDVVL